MLPSDTLSYLPSSSHHHHLCSEFRLSTPSPCPRARNSVVRFPLRARASGAVRSCPATSRSLYDFLELSGPGVSLADIKQAYRQMARKYHPDVCPPHQAQESTRRFIEIQEAFETLSDPRQRAIYDHAMEMSRIPASATGKRPWMRSQMDAQPSDWRSQWEFQLSELRLRSSIKAQTADSWGARMRHENGLC